MTKLQYRPELDGLRALAVIPVILFHAGLESLSGGFLGVDVFFVISGYLITNIIYSEMTAGRFTFKSFYERRARRILPALVLVCMVSVPAAYFILLPTDFKEFAGSLVSVFLFVSNFFFWTQTDYFATSSDLKPLLHTWSLAVEEQFYIFFPILLLALRNFSRKTVLNVILVLSLGSFLFSIIGSRRFFDANFFLLPSRAWELGAGAAIALALGGGVLSKSKVTAIGGWLGLILVLGSYVFLDKTMLMPGLFSVFPVLGTVLIICCVGHSGDLSTRVMSFKPMVWIGLISYSAYLWHQPIFAFARHLSVFELTFAASVLMVAFTILLSWLTTKFVEAPFRNKKLIKLPKIAGMSGLASVAFIALGAFVFINQGLPERKDGLAGEVEQLFQRTEGLASNCHLSPLPKECMKSGNASEQTVAIWGDSFAMHLVDGIISSHPDLNLIQLTMHSCPPFASVTPFDPWSNGKKGQGWTDQCRTFNENSLRHILDNPDIEAVVISSQFSQIERAKFFVDDNGQQTKASIQNIEPYFRKTLDLIEKSGKNVSVIGPMPNSHKNYGRCLSKSLWFEFSADSNCQLSVSNFEDGVLEIEAMLERLAQDFPIMSLKDSLCKDGVCKTFIEGTPLYYDTGHLTKNGSAALGQHLGFYDFIVGSSVSN